MILALTEDANRTDADIADLYDLKKGTVSSVRRRILDAGAIHYAYVPAFNKLGCEMIGFHYGTTDPAVRSDIKANHYMEFCNRTPQVFFALIGGSDVIFFTALRNATESEALVQHYNQFFSGGRRASKARLSNVVFPFALSRGTYVPQFAPLVHDYFKLDVPPPKNRSFDMVKCEQTELSATERATLCAMVANPSASDRQIASLIRLSRQAITRIRNKFTDDGLLTKICIPCLYRWGFEIYAAAHPRFSMDVSWEKRIRTEPRAVIERSFYFLSKADESVANYMISKFTEYSEQLENILGWYHKVKAFDGKPEIVLFSLDRSTELRTFDYAPTVRHLLMLETRPDDALPRGNL